MVGTTAPTIDLMYSLRKEADKFKMFEDKDLDKTIKMKNTRVSLQNHIEKSGIIKGVFKYGAWVQVGFNRTREYCIFVKWRDLQPAME